MTNLEYRDAIADISEKFTELWQLKLHRTLHYEEYDEYIDDVQGLQYELDDIADMVSSDFDLTESHYEEIENLIDELKKEWETDIMQIDYIPYDYKAQQEQDFWAMYG